jgi:hypothetical protein
MTSTSIRALTFARPVIQALTGLNVLYALAIGFLLVATFVMPGWAERALGRDQGAKYTAVPFGLRAIVVIGLVGAAIAHTILRRLLAIVDTVRHGDPFVLQNARHLDAIAWSVLLLEVLRLVVAGIASAVWKPGLVDGFSLASWLAVLMLFVLSGVFAHGARMRADLEGTV